MRWIAFLALLQITACAAGLPRWPAEPSTPSFEKLVEGHDKHEGLLTLYDGTKDLYAIIPDSILGIDLGMMAIRDQGSGGLLLRGTTTDTAVVRFERTGHHITLSRINTNFTAARGSPFAPAVAGNFSNSPIFSAEILTVPGQPLGTLVKLNDLLKPELLELIDQKLPFKVQKHPTLTRVTVGKDTAVLRIAYRLTRDPNKKPSNPGIWTLLQEPHRLADGKNVEALIDLHFFRLPQDDYATRVADPRLGGFALSRKDYSNLDDKRTAFSHLLIRWGVKPKDPSAKVSDAANPIVFTMDPSIPPRWRSAVREATLWWNSAFEATGIRNAVVVRDPPEDPEFDHQSLESSMIYWALTDDLIFSGIAGPQYIDPRTGQILKSMAHINAELPSFTLHRYLVYAWWRMPQAGESPSEWKRRLGLENSRLCSFAPSLSSQLAFGRLILKSRGHLATAEAEKAFQEAALKLVVAHEVGHALGLHHNFKASLISSAEDVRTGKVTARPDDHPMTGSIMDYNPVYIPPKGDMSTDYFLNGVGPYDRLMIEFAYRAVEHLPRSEQKKVLDKIARQAEVVPGFAFDNGLLSSIDPSSNTDDLGRDPLAFAEERLTMIHEELLPQLAKLVLAETHTYATIRQALDAVVFSVALDYVDILTRHVGGQTLLRVTPGASSENEALPIQVVPADRQRQALAVLAEHIFGPRAFPTPPDLLNALKADLHEDWNFPHRLGTNYDIHQRIEFVYKAAVTALLSRDRLTRILDNEDRVKSDDSVFTVAELFTTLSRTAFDSLDRPSELSRRQRMLQSELVAGYTHLALDPKAGPEPARQLAQRELDELRQRLARAQRRRISNPYVTAHLASLEREINRTLDAKTVLTPAHDTPNPG